MALATSKATTCSQTTLAAGTAQLSERSIVALKSSFININGIKWFI